MSIHFTTFNVFCCKFSYLLYNLIKLKQINKNVITGNHPFKLYTL